MSDQFGFDVFISHSPKDKAVVRPLAERLRRDGVRVWFDEWELKPSDSILSRVEQGLERSRTLLFCMSAHAFGADWAILESQTLRFRDPLNKERRFIPLRLDESPIKSSLAQFLYINWPGNEGYGKLLEACRVPKRALADKVPTARGRQAEQRSKLRDATNILQYAFSPDGTTAVVSAADVNLKVFDTASGREIRSLAPAGQVWSVAWGLDHRHIISGPSHGGLRLWNVETGQCLRVFESSDRHSGIQALAWSPDQTQVLSASDDTTICLWDIETGRCLRVFEGHSDRVQNVAWSPDKRRYLSASDDKTLRLWDSRTGRCLRVFEGHTSSIRAVAWNPNRSYAISGSNDGDLKIWEVETGRCVRTLRGHSQTIRNVAWNANQRHAVSGSNDNTLRLWDLRTADCLVVLMGHHSPVCSVAWTADQRSVLSGDASGGVQLWNLASFVSSPQRLVTSGLQIIGDQVQYTNAKVLLVGESGVGKTGLSKRLALDDWQPSDSTVGAWATHWKLPVSSDDTVEREIWLWDFGGQADQRLIHQLYMEDTALAVLVFDGQKEDLFETLGQWDRDLTRASRKPFIKVLVAGRVDAGGLRVSQSQLEAFIKERGFSSFLETSAKANVGCRELKEAILSGIRWSDIPWRSSPGLFKRLKEEIIRLKDEGRVLMRFNELRDALRLRLSGKDAHFEGEELKAVIGLLAGPGVVWELAFGSWVLLQPERINAYAQAVIHTMREDKHERGCLPEEQVLNGSLVYQSSVERLKADDERFVLLAMHQTLVERGLCLRQHTDKGPLLIFPSYYRRERPELTGYPAVLVSYRFNGFLDDVYATLVVRLHHTDPFQQDELWRYAADFRTLTGKQLGVKLTRRAEGAGELEVYFDPTIEIGEKIIFSKYVHEHLLQNARDVVRLRHYVCPHCGTPVGNREIAMQKLEQGQRDIPCINCDDPAKRIPLWDEMEELFASEETRAQVRDLQEQAKIVLDNESKDRALVGEVISTVALAGQISREFNVSDHGIDMEIEFKSDAGEATGSKLYLQLKSGDSYLREHKRDGAEIFTIRDERHARYWMAQAFPVLLIIRNSEGVVRWMEVSDWLKKASNTGHKHVKQIAFTGERFDVMSIRRWRDRVLAKRQAGL